MLKFNLHDLVEELTQATTRSLQATNAAIWRQDSLPLDRDIWLLPRLATILRDTWEEFEANKTPARFAKSLDRYIRP